MADTSPMQWPPSGVKQGHHQSSVACVLAIGKSVKIGPISVLLFTMCKMPHRCLNISSSHQPVRSASARVTWDMASEQQHSMEVAELGPAPQFQKSNPNVQYPPFRTLFGEHALLLSKTTEGTAMVTNFRFFVYERRSFINVPLMMIGEVVVADAYCWLKVCCKDAATYSCTFATPEDCQACVSLLREKTGLPRNIKDIFAYRFYALTTFQGSFDRVLTIAEAEQVNLCKPVSESFRYTFGKEVERQGFDTNKRKIWRMSHANEKFEFCQTYPECHIMPAAIDDAELRRSLDFRAMKRFPSVVWRARNIGVVLVRSSQPMSSFLGLSYFSNHADISLLEKIVEACH
ncbi:myotubularin-related protein 4, partial [Elysia marginata]